jgi:23S rRNA pseudouridine2605 synthase
MTVRLPKFLAQTGGSSRRKAEELIRSGAVRVNGEIAKTFGVQVDPERDRVEVNGVRVKPETPLYRLLLKPRACLSTLKKPTGDDAERATLLKYVTDTELGWQVVAPLDYPSEGVILLTTDGALAERLSRGGGKVSMTYHLKYQGKVGDEEVGMLLRGWKWEKRTIKPETVVALATTGKNTWVEMVVKEARPRVLKASGDAIRKPLLKISRVRLGPLSFEGLGMGEHRELKSAEVKSLRRAAGIEEADREKSARAK